jgi:hypothetical protein
MLCNARCETYFDAMRGRKERFRDLGTRNVSRSLSFCGLEKDGIHRER